MARERARGKALRGGIQFAVLLAVLSFILPGRGITLALGAAAVGFIVGFAAETALNRGRR